MANNNHENDPLLNDSNYAGTGETTDPPQQRGPNPMIRVPTAPGHLTTDLNDGVNEEFVGRGSVAALTSLEGDGLAMDDPGGAYFRENNRDERELSIVDPALHAESKEDAENKKKGFFARMFQLSNFVKIILIVLTIAIYTAGPMLNSFATKVPGIQFDFLKPQTQQDFYEMYIQDDGKKKYHKMRNGASKFVFISKNEYAKKVEDDKSDTKHLRMEELWTAAEKSSNMRNWQGRIDTAINGDYALFVEGQGDYDVTVSLQDKDKKAHGGEVFSFASKGKTVSKPVQVTSTGDKFEWLINVKFNSAPAGDDFLKLKYYHDDIPNFATEDGKKKLMDRGRDLQFWKHNGKLEEERLNDILQDKNGYKSNPTSNSWKDAKGELPQGKPYNALVVITFYKIVSIACGFLLSFILAFIRKREDKLEYVKKCFDLKAILKFAPCSVGWVIGDLAEMFSSSALDPALYSVFTQMRLVLTAIVAYIILKRKQNTLQWIMLSCLTLTVICFDIADKSGGGSVPFGALMMVVLKVGISVMCGVYGEKVFKGIHVPYPVQIVNILIVSVPFGAIALIPMSFIVNDCDIFKYGLFDGPDFGFDGRTWVVLFFYVGREWMTNLCVKRFSAVIKNVCNAVAPLVTYLIQALIMQNKKFELAKLFLILVVVLEVTNYSLARSYSRGPADNAKPKAEELPTTMEPKKDDAEEAKPVQPTNNNASSHR